MVKWTRAIFMERKSSIDLQNTIRRACGLRTLVEDERTLTIFMKSQKHSHQCPACGQEMHVYHTAFHPVRMDEPSDIPGRRTPLSSCAVQGFLSILGNCCTPKSPWSAFKASILNGFWSIQQALDKSIYAFLRKNPRIDS